MRPCLRDTCTAVLLQRARWLQGALSFLLALRCLRPLGWQSATASRSLSGLLAPVVRPPFIQLLPHEPVESVNSPQ